MKNEKKMDNNGFSLVELIIVIAIMAVLIGILAPQYVRYVEKGRVSADAATVDSYIDAMQVLAVDPDIVLSTTDTYTVTSAGGTGAIVVTGSLATLLEEFEIDSAATLTSTAYKTAAITLTLEYDGTKQQWKVTKSGIPS